ncbi:hypothetical protein GF327_03480 [Candidatus Woesearchaeota archaeon]|nr:hypothetical protein [Candidatus Woesearchaeota archaeon]
MAEKDYKNQIEAVLFSSGRFMDAETLMSLTGASSKQVIESNVAKLISEYEQRESPLMIVSENQGWKINVREKYLSMVRKIVSDIELPKTLLETLAVIAWQAPVLQSRVIDIRHNKAYDHIKELVSMGFISKEDHGRTYMLKLRNKFFDYFEVESKKDIRELFREIKEPEQKKVDEFEKEVYEAMDSEAGDEKGELVGSLDDFDDAGEGNEDTGEGSGKSGEVKEKPGKGIDETEEKKEEFEDGRSEEVSSPEEEPENEITSLEEDEDREEEAN